MHLSFNDELLSFSSTNEEGHCRLVCSRNRLNHGCHGLQRSCGPELRLPGQLEVRCVKVVNEASTGLMMPCVIVGPAQSSQESQERVFYIVMLVGDVLQAVRKFKSCPSLGQQMVLLDGPSVCILDGHVMKFFHYKFDHNYLSMDTMPIHAEANGAQMDLIAASLLKCISLVAFVRILHKAEAMDTDHCGEHDSVLHAVHYKLESGEWTEQLIKSTWFIPQIYESVLSCICMVHIEISEKRTKTKMNVFSNKILLGTSQGQILLLKEGHPQNYVTLPSTDVTQIVHWCCHSAHESAAVLTKQGCLYLINLDTVEVSRLVRGEKLRVI